LLFGLAYLANAQQTLLNVSYDVSRELYKDFNVAFADYWLKKTGDSLLIRQSHGGSSKQAGAVIAGLEADVVTMNQQTDIDEIASHGLISKDWRDAFSDNSAPYTSTTVFLVRKDNPKDIQDWTDLIKPDVQVILPNPKTSGNARYSYLAAWSYALKTFGNEERAKEFVNELFKQVPILNTGGRHQAIMNSLFMVIELILAIFLERTTKKDTTNSSKPSSQTEKDESALGRAGSHGKGKADNKAPRKTVVPWTCAPEG